MSPNATILHGDCSELIATLPDHSVDAIVTDPPYELGFMGKKWDAAGIAYDRDLWAECLRVLKPGGHLLAFGGTRTYHRMTAAIEDAGFEIRDSIHWLYGSGFPKSLDVSKAIDKQRHDRAEVYRVTAWIREARDAAGISNRDIDNAFGFAGMAGHWTSAKSQPAVPTLDQVPTLLDVLGVALDDVPDDIRRLLWELNGRKGQPGENWARREVVGERTHINGGGTSYELRQGPRVEVVTPITAPATDAAREWEGWGTALKPAHEPIVVARKPLTGTVAANVLEYGTGALNIDGTRISYASTIDRAAAAAASMQRSNAEGRGFHEGTFNPASRNPEPWQQPDGRWPANLVFTHAADCVQIEAGATTTTFADAERPDIRGAKMHAGAERGTVTRQVATYANTPAVYQCAPDCPVAELDAQSGIRPGENFPAQRGAGFGKGKPTEGGARSMADSGEASRFFTVTEWDQIADAVPFRYVAKPSRRERDAGLTAPPDREVHRFGAGLGEGADPAAPAVNKNTHPTVKPLALMRWLVRLVTPPGGTVLEPFAGSGTTLAAAILEGFDVIGCEMTDEYLPIIEGRVAWARAQRENPSPPPATPATTAAPTDELAQLDLFGDAA